MLSLNKKQKIKNKSDISEIFKNGNRFNCNGFIIIYKINYNDKNRLAIIVSRKTGNAVKRNKIKRLFREMFRNNQINVPPYYDILIKPQTGFEMNSETVQCFKKWQEKSKR